MKPVPKAKAPKSKTVVEDKIIGDCFKNGLITSFLQKTMLYDPDNVELQIIRRMFRDSSDTTTPAPESKKKRKKRTLTAEHVAKLQNARKAKKEQREAEKLQERPAEEPAVNENPAVPEIVEVKYPIE